jgi:hypothetical protein
LGRNGANLPRSLLNDLEEATKIMLGFSKLIESESLSTLSLAQIRLFQKGVGLLERASAYLLTGTDISSERGRSPEFLARRNRVVLTTPDEADSERDPSE